METGRRKLWLGAVPHGALVVRSLAADHAALALGWAGRLGRTNQSPDPAQVVLSHHAQKDQQQKKTRKAGAQEEHAAPSAGRGRREETQRLSTAAPTDRSIRENWG